MKRKSTPSYLLHRQSGQARAAWTDADGVRRQKLLPGDFESTESRTAYAKLILELAEQKPKLRGAVVESVSVAELLLAFVVHANRYYVGPDGGPTGEVETIKYSIRPVRELFAELPVNEFGPLALEQVRERMVAAGLCRSLVNRRIDRVKRAFKWGVSKQLVPYTIYESLRTLPGLRKGRSGVRESEKVRPVEDGVVDATLPHLPPHVRAMVQVIRLTGARPGEVCGMTLEQIDRTGEVWVYRPVQHKTASKDKDRTIPIGPQAKAVLLEHLADCALEPDEPIFSPQRQREQRYAKLRANRKTKVQPSQTIRRKTKPKKAPREKYTPRTIAAAIGVAAKKAGVSHWFPYQLRHAHGTRVRKAFGLEHAGAALGHTKMSATEIYAERDAALAVKVAEAIG